MFMFSRKRHYPSGPQGYRAYVVGDVHGRLDLLDELLGKIEAEAGRTSGAEVLLVFVGDIIDRGPNSAQVVERLRTYRHSGIRPIFLLGNHEEVLLRVLEGDAELITKWRWFGGNECLQSYGVDVKRMASGPDALAAVRSAIPKDHVDFLKGFGDTFRFGDYLFVHAGLRPGVALAAQTQQDLRWIRGPFLDDDSDHGFVVVHGHTIINHVEERSNRIGIDTGAYTTGILTALAIEENRRWYLDTRQVAEAPAIASH